MGATGGADTVVGTDGGVVGGGACVAGGAGGAGGVMPRKNSCADVRAEPPTTLPPPATSTLPLGSKVAVWA